MSIERKLSAIMFTDIAGYTALSAEDENKALKLLDKQKQILIPIIEEYSGTLHNSIGDGLLFTFPTVTDAIRSGIKIQEKTKLINDLNLRIGIHEGEITLKDGDVLGDDVNVASRIEPFSAIGGIIISGKVQQNISSLPEFQATYIGTPELKGVSQEVKVYCITSHGLPDINIPKVSTKLDDKTNLNIYAITGSILFAIGFSFWIAIGLLDISFGSKEGVPSIAILMMDNRGSVDDDFWASGITEDLIVKVAGAGLIRVSPMKEILEIDSKKSFEQIAKNLRVQYILTSSIHKKEDGFDLRCHLIEAESGNSKYAKKWSEPINNAQTIVGKLADNILRSLDVVTIQEIHQPPTSNPEAYEYYLKGKYKYEQRQNMEDMEVARGLLQKAIDLDDNLLKAKNLFGWTLIKTNDYNEALVFITKTLNQAEVLDDKEMIALSLYYIGTCYMKKAEYDQSLSYFSQSVEISEILGDKHGLSKVFQAMGSVYSYPLNENSNFNISLEYYTRALEIIDELGDNKAMVYLLQRFGFLNLNQYDIDKALGYYTRALEKGELLNDKSWLNVMMQSFADAYYIMGQYDKALDYYTRSLIISEELGDNILIGHDNFNHGDYYFNIGDYEKAVKYLDSFLHNFKRGKLSENIENYVKFLATTRLFISYNHLGIKYDEKRIEPLLKNMVYFDYDINYLIFQLLNDNAYLETAYNEVQEIVNDLTPDLKSKFLNYSIPKKIVEGWEKVQ